MRKKWKVAIIVLGLLATSVAVVPAMAATKPAGPSAQQLLARVKKGCPVVSKGKYKTDDDARNAIVAICKAGKSYVWNADMDVDCDGVRTSHCNSHTDCCYPGATSFHTSKGRPFQADLTHFYVIPLPSSRFSYTKAGIKPG